MLCLPSDVQPLEWVHPINSVRILCEVPKAFLQLRFRYKTLSTPGDTFQLPLHFLSLFLNSLAYKTGLERAQDSWVSHRCVDVDGWKKAPGEIMFSHILRLPIGSSKSSAEAKVRAVVTTFLNTEPFGNSSVGTADFDALCIATHRREGCRIRANIAKAVEIRHAVRMTYRVFSKNKHTAVVWVYRPIKHPSKDKWKFW